MFTSFATLLSVAALASTAFAQSISIVSPAAGATLVGGQTVTVELKESAVPSWQTIQEASLAIAISSGATFDGSTLGPNAIVDTFKSQWTDSEGNKYANFSVDVPNSFDGPVTINVAHYYLLGEYSTSQLEYQSVGVTVTGNTG